ncbi:hypothetical protein Tco_0486439 [Tanacetum coccineum]
MMYALAGPYMGKIVDAYADTECMRRDYVDRKSTNGICTSDDVVKTILFVREIEKTTLAEISTTKAMNTKRANFVITGRVKVPAGRYVVPTGRVKVLASRYVVPTGKDNVIVSAGRTKVIPVGSTILVLVACDYIRLLCFVYNLNRPVKRSDLDALERQLLLTPNIPKTKPLYVGTVHWNSWGDEGHLKGLSTGGGENLNIGEPGTGRTPPGGTSAPAEKAQGCPSPAFVKENIDVLRTMIKELDNRGQEKVTPRKLFNEESGGARSENSQMSSSAEEVGGYSSDVSSRSRCRGSEYGVDKSKSVKSKALAH